MNISILSARRLHIKVLPLLMTLCMMMSLLTSCGDTHQRWSHFYTIPPSGLQPNEVLIFRPDSTFIKAVEAPDFHSPVRLTLFTHYRINTVPRAITLRLDAEMSDLTTRVDTIRIPLLSPDGLPLGKMLHGRYTQRNLLPPYPSPVVSLTLTPVPPTTLQGIEEIGIDFSEE